MEKLSMTYDYLTIPTTPKIIPIMYKLNSKAKLSPAPKMIVPIIPKHNEVIIPLLVFAFSNLQILSIEVLISSSISFNSFLLLILRFLLKLIVPIPLEVTSHPRFS